MNLLEVVFIVLLILKLCGLIGWTPVVVSGLAILAFVAWSLA